MMEIKRLTIESANLDVIKRCSLRHNPFVQELDCCSLEAIENGTVLGRVDLLPLQLMAYGRVFHVCGGSALSVNPEFRGRGIAKRLTTERIGLSCDRIAIASGLSNMSFPLFNKLGFVTFSFPRLILLKRSRPVLETRLKGKPLRVASTVIDSFLGIHNSVLRFFSIWRNKKTVIQEVSVCPQDIADIVFKDAHPFKENHTKEWFDWVLNYPFCDDHCAKQHLFQVIVNGEIQGFFMTKERFHEQASHRGFKNVILGSVIEWGVLPGGSITENQVCKAAVLSFGKNVDAVEICVSDNHLIKSLKKCGLLRVGDSNFAFKAAEDSPFERYKDEYRDLNKWRIRPAYSDNGLS